jgi:NitT/TauT family transport system substrate-binding protein
VKIKLMENFRAIFYAPYYAIHALGFYKSEGIDVELTTSDTPGDAVAHLINGTIDLTWGGPMRVMMAHDRDPGSSLISFGEVVSRDPFFLIGHCEGFALAKVAQLRFATVSEVPTPWTCLQYDLRQVGINPEAIKRVSDRTMAENYESLRKGELDVMQAFEPFGSMAEMDHTGKLLYAASSRGPTVYTAFIATRAAIARQREVFVAMTRALAKMEQWLYANSAEELGKAIAPFFPHVPNDILVPSLRRYRDAGLWARNPAMSKQGFNRLGLSFVSGGLLQRPPVYEDCVEQTLY